MFVHAILLFCIIVASDAQASSESTTAADVAVPPTNQTAKQVERERFINLLSSEMSPTQPVNSQEYYSFLDSLSKIEQVRRSKFDRLSKVANRNRNHKPSSGDLAFRKFNYSLAVKLEEFDCDLNLLANCESSLLEKIEKIEDHHVVFPVLSIEELATTQEDILELCRSIDHEFQCLYNFVEKCEQKMTAATFAILKYVITKNNETIISCRQKERDWLGWEGNYDNEPDHELEPLLVSSSGRPCIAESEVHNCINRTFGADFDPIREEVKTRSRCDCVVRYERCLKEAFFQQHPDNTCTLEEKELSLQYLLNMIHFSSSHTDSSDYAYCRSLADRITKQFGFLNEAYIVVDKPKIEDRAYKMVNMLRFYYNSIPSEKCQRETLVVNELCYAHLENRLRLLWNQEDLHARILWPKDELNMMCCATAELSNCMSTFVLVYCGLDQHLAFRDQIEHLRLQALPSECGEMGYGSQACRSVLFK